MKNEILTDISRIDGKRRNEKLAMMILRSYARNISSLVKKTTMLADVVSSEEIECSIDTFNLQVVRWHTPVLMG